MSRAALKLNRNRSESPFDVQRMSSKALDVLSVKLKVKFRVAVKVVTAVIKER